jgi:cytochrome c peroxidase
MTWKISKKSSALANDSRVHLAMGVLLVVLLGVVFWPSPSGDLIEGESGLPQAAAETGEPITPVVPFSNLDERKLALGRDLFFDPRLSADDSVSCATCHNPALGGTDNQPVSTGVKGSKGVLNAPTVLNAALNFRQFWNGRAETLEEQIDGPISNPVEMASSWPQVIAKLDDDAALKRRFADLYADGISPRTIRDAIATFERSLLTPNAPFDRFLLGDENAISAQAREGYRLFLGLGCATCHQGSNVGGNMYEKLGATTPYYTPKNPAQARDNGRYDLTRVEEHRTEFKVPGLRNVARTAPYFHDGSIKTLEEAVTLMARHQLDMELPPTDVARIVAFLNALTGQLDGKPL